MGVKISALPDIATPALTDVFPVVQDGVTYKETITQLSSLLGTLGVTTVTGTANQVIVSSPTGAITLSLPQSIASTSNVTFGSVTFNPTTKGIVGTLSNNNAGAGFVGELIESTVANVAIANNTFTNVTSISLTAGDWDVFGGVLTNPDITTTQVQLAAGISLTSVTLPTDIYLSTGPANAGRDLGGAVPTTRLSLSGTNTVYLVAIVGYATSTLDINGRLSARRRR